MNLLDTPWLPVRRRCGERVWTTPLQALSDPEMVAIDADRGDFNVATMTFLVGLLQTVSPVDTATSWKRMFTSPPGLDTLQEWCAPVRSVFEVDGDGPRFMQSLPFAATEITSIAGLLIDSPSKNGIELNRDLFIRRSRVRAVCPCCAAMALFTLQINAPEGGRGVLTGLRGGGPLNTLIVCMAPRSLWHDVWLNVQQRGAFLSACGDAGKTAPHFSFPWLAEVAAIQPDGGQTAPLAVHPAHVWWAMPRRIRLDFDQTVSGECDLCGRAGDKLLTQYITRPQGLNYKGPWAHPLSPYYQVKDEWWPVHPQPDGLGYRHWVGWVLGMAREGGRVRPAKVVDTASKWHDLDVDLCIWASGYAMKQAKALCWYESRLPLFGLPQCDEEERLMVAEDVGAWVMGAEQAARCLRAAVAAAWFPGDTRGDLGQITASFWAATEAPFYRLVRERIESARSGQEHDAIATAERWLSALNRAALDLFDHQYVGAGNVERQHPDRIATAYRGLRAALNGKAIRQALRLPVKEIPASRRGPGTATRRSGAAASKEGA
ncbi:MAG: type I-E CRISPR-associated protein Cse1/CasA [Aquabacterium sp.]|nr:type I-E CRISPR-associated protein Cse1/CasA [Aquabacterium sp.]